MIKDHLKNIDRYSINKNFETIKKVIDKKVTNLEELPSSVKAIELEYETQEFDYNTFENHIKNIDIHVIHTGKEKIALNIINELKASTDYNEEKDYQIFEGLAREVVVLQENEFLILFPGEAHITGGRLNEVRTIVKTVFKLPIV